MTTIINAILTFRWLIRINRLLLYQNNYLRFFSHEFRYGLQIFFFAWELEVFGICFFSFNIPFIPSIFFFIHEYYNFRVAYSCHPEIIIILLNILRLNAYSICRYFSVLAKKTVSSAYLRLFIVMSLILMLMTWLDEDRWITIGEFGHCL